MNMQGRYNHIEDVLATLHSGQWFGWSDPDNKVYENLVILDESKEKPTKEFLEDELKKQQVVFDAKAYARARSDAYPSYADQFDTIYHQGIDAWKAEIKKVKDANPKPSE